jgi:LmbE family N-acetylglucosaminyl deacetylase
VKHVFVSPHPDDVALSCGGLIESLRDRGDDVTILTVFSGAGELPQLTPFQRLALGFGCHESDASEAFGPPIPTPVEVMTIRRAEDAAYAHFVGASIVFVNRPDAVFRDYHGDAQLLGKPHSDDPSPVEELRGALAELELDRLYLPLAIGGHVDHRQTHQAAMELLAAPGSPLLGCTAFYEDFPYAALNDFQGLDQLDPETLANMRANVVLEPEYCEIRGVIDRKLEGLRSYESQMGRLFGGDSPMDTAVRERAARVGEFGGRGPAERYWRVTPNFDLGVLMVSAQ